MPQDPENLNPENIIFERRKFVRVKASFVVSYTDITTREPKSDITQTKNISVGGILFTTDRFFQPETILRLKIRLPDSPDYTYLKAKVLDSKQRVKDVLYDTRVKFIGIKEEDRAYIRKIVGYNARNQ